jgi:homoserine kinase
MVAAAAAALRASGEEPESGSLYQLVSLVEGHGDNAGAAVYGGLVAVADGALRHLELSPDLSFVFGIPDEPLKTKKARHALPAEVSRAAAARNVARMAFLIEGLRTGDPAALAHAGGDEIHEIHRAGLSPVTSELMEAARSAGALHAAWSGAGPTAVAVTIEPGPVVEAMNSVLAGQGRAMILDVAKNGWS